MKYTVEWKPVAEAHLTDLWQQGPDRAAVAAAADWLDAELAKNPHGIGESRDGNVRIVFVEPLAALFEVFDSTSRVDVLKVWRPR